MAYLQFNLGQFLSQALPSLPNLGTDSILRHAQPDGVFFLLVVFVLARTNFTPPGFALELAQSFTEITLQDGVVIDSAKVGSHHRGLRPLEGTGQLAHQ